MQIKSYEGHQRTILIVGLVPEFRSLFSRHNSILVLCNSRKSILAIYINLVFVNPPPIHLDLDLISPLGQFF